MIARCGTTAGDALGPYRWVGSRVVLERQSVLVSVEGAFACAVVQHVYRNDGNTIENITYSFPVETSWTITSIGIRVGAKSPLMEAELMEKSNAEKTYERAAAAGADTVIASVQDHDRMRIKIAKIESGGIVSIELRCVCVPDSVLTSKGAARRLSIPTEIGELYGSYTPDDIAHGRIPVIWSYCVPRPPNVVIVDSAAVSVDVVVDDPRGIAEVWCPTHPEIKPDSVGKTQGPVHISTKRDLPFTGGGVVINITPNGAPETVASCVVESSSSLGSIAVATITRLVPTASTRHVASDIVFVVDCSGSMEDYGKIESAKNATITAIANLPSDSRFSVILFSNTTKTFGSGMMDATNENTAAAIAFVRAAVASGGTETNNAMIEAYRALGGIPSVPNPTWQGEVQPEIPQKPKRTQSVVLVTDGLVSEIDSINTTAKNALANGVRTFALGIGTDVRREQMVGISMSGGGVHDIAATGDEVVQKILGIVRAATSSVIHGVGIDVSVAGKPLVPSIIAGKRGDVSTQPDAEMLTVAIYKTNPIPDTLTIVAKCGDEIERSVTVNVPQPGVVGHFIIPRSLPTEGRAGGSSVTTIPVVNTVPRSKTPARPLPAGWLHAAIAGMHVEELVTEQPGEQDVIGDRIRDIGLAYHIATEKTAFVFVAPSGSKKNQPLVQSLTPALGMPAAGTYSASLVAPPGFLTKGYHSTQPRATGQLMLNSGHLESVQHEPPPSKTDTVVLILGLRTPSGNWTAAPDFGTEAVNRVYIDAVDSVQKILESMLGELPPNDPIVITLAVLHVLETVYSETAIVWKDADAKAREWLKTESKTRIASTV